MQELIKFEKDVLAVQASNKRVAISQTNSFSLYRIKKSTKEGGKKYLRLLTETSDPNISIINFKVINRKFSTMTQKIHPFVYVSIINIRKRKMLKTTRIGNYNFKQIILQDLIHAFCGVGGFCVVNLRNNEILHEDDEISFCKDIAKINEQLIAIIFTNQDNFQEQFKIVNWKTQQDVFISSEKTGNSLIGLSIDTLLVCRSNNIVQLYKVETKKNDDIKAIDEEKIDQMQQQQGDIEQTQNQFQISKISEQEFGYIWKIKNFSKDKFIACDMSGKLTIFDKNLKKLKQFSTKCFQGLTIWSIYNNRSIFVGFKNSVSYIQENQFESLEN